ncbi:anaerobic C4-dicarboxylate transporter [Escherichia coli]|nr:anaerobic C4-dicarboxylate transporter [Escherichia coli]
MLVVELIIVLLAIFLGARLGGIGIGFAGGLGVLVLAAIGVKPGNIPFDVISIIMAVIAAISAMQVAGGLDYLVHQTEKLLRRNPKYITITASPISAAVVYMSSVMEGHGISYLHLLSVVIPSTLLAVLVMSFLVTMLFNSKLSDDPIYRKRLEEGLVELRGEKQIEIKSGAKTSVWLFLLGVVGVVIYAIINSPSMGLVEKPLMNTTNAILIIMLSVATLTTVICKVDTDNILNSSTFKAGMSACICILGVAWLGDTFVSNNIDWIKDTAGEVIQGHPWLLAVIFFFASALLYSQAATAKALMPMALALNVSPLTAVASFAAVSGLFILPTYPTLVAAVQMDDTGTTRIGKFVFNHPFFIPGTLGVALAVCFGFVLGSFML